MAVLSISQLAPALRQAERQVAKAFEKETPAYNYLTLSERGRVAHDAMILLKSLISDRRRLKKWQREWLKKLEVVATEKNEEPVPIVTQKGFRLPIYTKKAKA